MSGLLHLAARGDWPAFAAECRRPVQPSRFDRDAADLAAIALRLGGDQLRTRRLLMAALLRACPACELRPIIEGELELTATLDDPDDREGWAARRDTHYAIRDALADLADRHDDLGHDADEKADWAPEDWSGHGTHDGGY